MKKKDDFELLKLSKSRRFLYKLKLFFCSIPHAIWSLIKKIGRFFKKLGIKIKDGVIFIFKTFKDGSWKTKISYFIMGFGNFSRKQWIKGLLFFIFEIVFILYMVFTGGHWLSKFGTLGNQTQVVTIDDDLDIAPANPDNSFKILLYGLLTIVFIFSFIITWYMNVKQCAICDKIEKEGKKVKSNKDDLKSLLDDNFHKTLLALPVLGVIAFTIIPIIFMILVAFTNYDGAHNGSTRPFGWVGFDNFNALINFSSSGSNFSVAFGEILVWTLIWAVFATFTNYFLGMLVAIMINKKGIKGKKFFRTVLVLTIAVPQFISLLYISNMFADNGLINLFLSKVGLGTIPFWTSPNLARIMVILVNIWVGIPYLMLITTGILMNIPQDLYESARIDGANSWQQYTKITLPYMLFVTGPYLLTSFISNINNFNVIYLLTGGRPNDPRYLVDGNSGGSTDLLITWLYKLTSESAVANYKLAAVIGIFVFIIVAMISLIVYNLLPSNRNERDFS